MGIALYAIYCFSFAAINSFSLYLTFASLINMYLSMFLLGGYPVWYSLHFLDLIDYFPSHIKEVFNYNIFKYFLKPFLFLLFFWDTYNLNVCVFNVVPEVSEIVLISFNSFFFFPLWFIYFYHSIFYLTYPIFCLCYSTVCSLQSVFDLIYCIIHYILTF